MVDADPSWPAQFDELADRIRALGDRVLELEHIGSTSVADLSAKPVIDIDLTVMDSKRRGGVRAGARAGGVRAVDP